MSIMAIRDWLGDVRRSTSGVAAMEFALILPILLALIIGTVEVGRLLIVTQKLQNGTFIVADLAARDETLTADQLDMMFLAFDSLIEPFDFASDGQAIISSVTADAMGDPMINWQRTGAGSLDVESEIGVPGGAATLPDVLTMVPGETLIVAETHFQYAPIFSVSGGGNMLSKYAYVRPRLGTLETLE